VSTRLTKKLATLATLQRDVDVVAPGDLVFDGRQAFRGRRDLDHDVRSRAPVVQVLRELDRLFRAVGDRRPDLDRHEAVLAFGPVVDRPEDVGRRLDVFDHQVPEHVRRSGLLADQLDHRLVVVRRAADGLLEDRRVRRHARDPLVAKTRQLSGGDQLAANVVEPQRLPDVMELFDRRWLF
jgi:hypothetical protein